MMCQFRSFFTLVFVLIAATSLAQKAPRPKNEFVVMHGRKFVMQLPKTDTVILIDPITGEELTKTYTQTPCPTYVDRKKVYQPSELKEQAKFRKDSVKPSLEEYVLNGLKSTLSTLQDGEYILNIKHVIVDTKGRVIYYQCEGIKYVGYYKEDIADTAFTAALIDTLDELLINEHLFDAAKKDYMGIVSAYPTAFEQYVVVLKEHVVTIKKM